MTYSEPYPSAGQQPTTSAGPLAPPRGVTIAYYLFLLTALAKLVLVIISFAQLGNVSSMAASRVSTSGTSITHAQAESIITASIIVSLVLAIAFLIAFVIFDVFMRRGANWARIILLIITILSLTGVTGGYGVGALGVVASIVAVILMFVGQANPYFRAVKQQKLAAKGYGGQYPGAQPPAAPQQ